MTAQVPEKLVFNGEKTSMTFCPPLPEQHPRIIKLDDKDMDHNDYWVFSTACWREYVGTWEIKNDQFYLVDIAGRYKINGKDPILADWFSGVICIPQGDLLQYVHMGFGSVYEQEIHIKIENGKVIDSTIIDNEYEDFFDGDDVLLFDDDDAL